MKQAPDRNAFAQLVETLNSSLGLQDLAAMPLLTNTSSVSGQTWSRSQIPLQHHGLGAMLD
jgi:hypothetical protein